MKDDDLASNQSNNRSASPGSSSNSSSSAPDPGTAIVPYQQQGDENSYWQWDMHFMDVEMDVQNIDDKKELTPSMTSIDDKNPEEIAPETAAETAKKVSQKNFLVPKKFFLVQKIFFSTTKP